MLKEMTLLFINPAFFAPTTSALYTILHAREEEFNYSIFKTDVIHAKWTVNFFVGISMSLKF